MDDTTEERKKLEARREARRKRILQNAENRLKLITGSNEEILVKPVEIANVTNIPDEHVTFLEETTYESAALVNPYNEKPEAIINETLDEKEILPSNTSIFEYYNILLVTVAILTHLFKYLGVNYYLKESVFMPFFLLEIILIIFRNEDVNSNSILQTILLLSNLHPKSVTKIMCVVKRVEEIVRDFSIYFFTFLVFHFCFEGNINVNETISLKSTSE